MKNTAALVFAALLPAVVAAQDSSSIKKLFEAGKYEDVVRDASDQRSRGFETAYLAAQSYLKLDQPDKAKEQFSWIQQEGDEVWALIGRSSISMADDQTNDALQTARDAVERAPDHLYAQYQLGLVYGNAGDHAKAAEAFENAARIDPSFAYAHYYAGLEYNRAKRADRMSSHFEAFLKLAPQAPERPAVESIMRTMRGR